MSAYLNMLSEATEDKIREELGRKRLEDGECSPVPHTMNRQDMLDEIYERSFGL